jgi:hypothetical protein
MSDLIKQEKQVRSGRLASANPTNPAGLRAGILQIARI